MIHFFRKIRQNLIKENRISKYLIYAIGEIVLVMVGILLALYFNNLNTESENLKKEELYLINIVEDIEYQKGGLKSLITHYKQSIEIGKSILKDYKTLKGFTQIDSLNDKLNFLMIVDDFPNTNNTYQELVNSGQQTLISSKELSIDIIDYYLFCSDNYISFKNNNDNIYYSKVYTVFNRLSQTSLADIELDESEDYLLDDDKISSQFIKNELKKPENILELLNAIKTQIIIHTTYLSMVEETLTASKELIIDIDKYLGLTSDMVVNYD